jgi:hypothetical protein
MEVESGICAHGTFQVSVIQRRLAFGVCGRRGIVGVGRSCDAGNDGERGSIGRFQGPGALFAV